MGGGVARARAGAVQGLGALVGARCVDAGVGSPPPPRAAAAPRALRAQMLDGNQYMSNSTNMVLSGGVGGFVQVRAREGCCGEHCYAHPSRTSGVLRACLYCARLVEQGVVMSPLLLLKTRVMTDPDFRCGACARVPVSWWGHLVSTCQRASFICCRVVLQDIRELVADVEGVVDCGHEGGLAAPTCLPSRWALL